MLVLLRGSLALACACLAAACEPPPADDPVGAAIIDLPEVQVPLPPAVAATVNRLREIGANGSYRDLAKLAEATPGFRSNFGDMSHKDYWYLKMRTGDWPMEQVEKLLSFPYAVRNSERGKIYIWPRVATLAPDQITGAAARDIERLLGEGQAEAIRNGQVWPGYVLGIAEDGTWLYFVAGAG